MSQSVEIWEWSKPLLPQIWQVSRLSSQNYRQFTFFPPSQLLVFKQLKFLSNSRKCMTVLSLKVLQFAGYLGKWLTIFNWNTYNALTEVSLNRDCTNLSDFNVFMGIVPVQCFPYILLPSLSSMSSTLRHSSKFPRSKKFPYNSPLGRSLLLASNTAEERVNLECIG